MKVILISGKAQNGKDTFANILKEKLEQKSNSVVITHFADLVKFVSEKYFGWNGLKDEVGRSILQKVGTDVVRTQKPNYWVDFVIGFLEMFRDEWDYVLIPDTRFGNEISRFDETWDTTSVRINRIDFTSTLTQEQLNHPSETALDNYNFDYVINSETGLDKLEKEVDKFIKWMEEMDG